MDRVFRMQLSLVLTARLWAPEPEIREVQQLHTYSAGLREVQQLHTYSAGLCGSFQINHQHNTKGNTAF
jgi:hypothetical protein